MKPNSIQKFFLYFFGIPHTPSQFCQVFRNSNNDDQLLEPAESKKYRRNILILACIVILAGLMDGTPRDINFFGLKPSDKADAFWFCLFIFLTQIYWYLTRYFSVMDDGEMRDFEHTTEKAQMQNALRSCHLTCIPKRSDLISNLTALTLTILSWYFLWSWSV